MHPDILTIPAEDLRNFTPITSGGFSNIFKAKWRSQGGKLVIIKKITNLHKTRNSEAEFNYEAKVMHRFTHEDIVKLYGVMEGQAHPVLVIEYMNFGSLKQILENTAHKEWITTHRISIALNIITALCYMHSFKFIHRDLNNKNILLTQDGTAKLSDFGLSVEYNTTDGFIADTVVGTWTWLAPELIKSADWKYFTASDLHQFGTFLWSLFSFCEPFQQVPAGTDPRVKYPREEIPSDTPSDIKALIMNLWSVNPKERYSAEQTNHIIATLKSG